MYIEKEFKKIELPEKYVRNGKECFFDTYRKRLIEITPEKIVRQRMARYLEIYLGVPKEHIFLEVAISHYIKGERGRADIVVQGPDDEYPIVIIECKNEKICLTDNVFEQVIKYSDKLLSDYYMVTNGINIEMAQYKEDNKYNILNKILKYEEMKNFEGEIIEAEEPNFVRFSIDELKNMNKIQKYNDSAEWIFGEDTLNENRSLSVNLYQALIDTNHMLPIKECARFKIVKDLGIRYMDYSNAGAGHFVGDYRSILIEDANKDNQIISFGIFGTGRGTILDKKETRKSYTTLNVTIDRYKESRTILEYNIDKYLVSNDKEYKFIHDGRISRISSSEMRKFVFLNSKLIEERKGNIYLGKIEKNKLIYFDDKYVSELIYALIEYALLREEYRNMKKNNKNVNSIQ